MNANDMDRVFFNSIINHLEDNCFGQKFDGTFKEKLWLTFPRCLHRALHLSTEDFTRIFESATGEKLPKYENVKKNTTKDLREIIFYCFLSGFIIYCCYIFLYKYLNAPPLHNGGSYEISMVDFLIRYPDFANLDFQEIRAGMRFHDMMEVVQACVPPQGNKQRLIEMATYLAEGHSVKYITGSGQTEATARRVLIFETVAGGRFKQRRVAATAEREMLTALLAADEDDDA